MMDLVVKNGTIVTAEKTFKSDIAISNQRIKKIGKNLKTPAKKTISANKLLVFPGIIDSHVHMHLPVMGTYSADNFYAGTIAAAAGGVTTIIDFVTPSKGENLFKALKKRKGEAQKSCIDYSFHMSIVDATEKTLKAIPKIIKAGIPSFKLYTVFKEAGLMLDDNELPAVLEAIGKSGGLPVIHAENHFILNYLQKRFIETGKTNTIYHAESRPWFVESEAIQKAIFLAEIAKSPLYIFHLSSKAGLNIINQAQKNKQKVLVETCPHFLLLTEEVYKSKDGPFYQTTPPVKELSDQKALWQGLKNKIISVVSTDHCPFTKKQKLMYGGAFNKTPNGLPGVETLLSLMYSEGVRKKKITLTRLVQVLCTNPAKIFGLYPKKGVLKEGSDADIIIFNPEAKKTISASKLHSKTDFSPYEGKKITGNVEYTISRGKIIYKDGRFTGSAGYGKFIPRSDTEVGPRAWRRGK